MISTHERTKTGIAGLDHILMGGLVTNRLFLIEGDPGAGKTTLGLQFLLAGREAGEKCLYITLSETKDELAAGAASHGWNLDGIDVVELAAPDSELSSDGQLTMYPSSEVELSETTSAVLAAVQRADPRRVVFDSLSEFRLLAQSPLRYRRQILALKQFFIGRKCTVLLLDDGTSEGSDVQLQSIAHGVITLEQLAPVYGAERRRLRVVKLRGSKYRGGFHDFTIVKGGLRVFPRLVAAEHVAHGDRTPVPSGVKALDALLGGGPDRGTSTLLMGPAGCGKSTVALQYAVAAALRGEKAALFAFDESSGTLLARARGIGFPIDQVLQNGTLTLRQVDPAELSPGEFAALVQDTVERDGTRLVLIDSLNGYLNAMPEEQFLTLQLHELLTYLGGAGVTTIMVVAQHGMIGTDIQAPVDTSYLADSVVLFRYFEHRGSVRKALSVIKKRSGRHEDTIRELSFDARGVHVSEPLAQFRGLLVGTPLESTEGLSSA